MAEYPSREEVNPEEQPIIKVVKIIKTPDGPAPEEIRQAWKGVILFMVEKPAVTPEIDPVNLDLIIRKGSYIIQRDLAYDSLKDQTPPEVSEKVIRWFEDNFPNEIEYFSFGQNEVEVLGKLDWDLH